MAITAITRDWGPNTSIVRIDTTDNLATIVTNGYLTAQAANIAALNEGAFQWAPDDLVAISYAGGKGFFNVDYTTNMTFLALSIAQNTIFVLSAAQIIAAYATPILVIPAAGAHTWIVLNDVAAEFDWGTVQFTGGGATGLQYDSTAHLAATKATSTIAGATIDGFTASNGVLLTPAATGTMASMVNKGIYWSNDTAPYAAGDSTITLNIPYSVYNTTA